MQASRYFSRYPKLGPLRFRERKLATTLPSVVRVRPESALALLALHLREGLRQRLSQMTTAVGYILYSDLKQAI